MEVEDFKKTWLEEIAKIEKRAIDSRGVYLVSLQFDRDKILFEMGLTEEEFTHDLWLELEMLESKLSIALETARSRYELQNRSLWARIIESISGVIYAILEKLRWRI